MLCLHKQAGPNRPLSNADQHSSFVQAPCRVDQAAQQPAQSAPRQRLIVRLKVPSSLGTVQQPALAQPAPATTLLHSSARLPPPEHAWGAEQPPRKHLPPRGDMSTSPHGRAWRVEQPGPAAPPLRAGERPPLPMWAPMQPPRTDAPLPLPTWAPVQPPRADAHLPLFTWAPAVQPMCADAHLLLPTWVPAVLAPREDEHPLLPTWAPAVQAPRTTDQLRPPKRVRADSPADACPEAAHASAAGCFARPAKQCHAGGPAKVLVGGRWAASGPSVQEEVVQHAEAHCGPATGVPRKSALKEIGGDKRACGPAKNLTGCEAARLSGVTRHYTKPHAIKAHATGCNSARRMTWAPALGTARRAATLLAAPARAVWAARALRRQRSARAWAPGLPAAAAVRAAHWTPHSRRRCALQTWGCAPHAGINTATTHHAGEMPSTVSDHHSNATTLVQPHALLLFFCDIRIGRAAGPRES